MKLIKYLNNNIEIYKEGLYIIYPLLIIITFGIMIFNFNFIKVLLLTPVLIILFYQFSNLESQEVDEDYSNI